MARETAAVLDAFHHPELRADRPVRELPIAARQVVEICRAMAARASIVLMDEPTSSLPREDVERLFALIRRLRDRGVAIVYISHFLEEVREIADRYTVLRDGRSVATGAIGGRDQRRADRAHGRPADGRGVPRAGAGAGRRRAARRARPRRRRPPCMQASLTLRKGEILGIAGLIGSGRTETDPRADGPRTRGGRARPAAQSRGCRSQPRPGARIRGGAGYLSEDRKGEGLALTMSLADNITCTRYDACSTVGLASARRASASRPARWIETLAREGAHAAQPARTLSGGNQQKVALARLMHQQADVLLLDEPTKGIDIGSKVEIYRAIVERRTRRGGAW